MALDKSLVLINTIVNSKEECMHELITFLKTYNDDEKGLVKNIELWIQGIDQAVDRIEELENNMYHIDSLIDEAENSISEIRGYTNV